MAGYSGFQANGKAAAPPVDEGEFKPVRAPDPPRPVYGQRQKDAPTASRARSATRSGEPAVRSRPAREQPRALHLRPARHRGPRPAVLERGGRARVRRHPQSSGASHEGWRPEESASALAELGDRPDPGRGHRGRLGLAFTKQLPWDDQYKVQAVFETAGKRAPDSPVRIAGVNVGKVTSVEHLAAPEEADPDGGRPTARTAAGGRAAQAATVVTMELEESACRCTRTRRSSCARACSSRATCSSTCSRAARTRRRPTTATFPVDQTVDSVQLDQVLTTLQADVRADLQSFLDQFGNALDQVRRRRGLPRALPLLARRVPLHVAGQRGPPRHRAARPLGPDRQPGPVVRGARPQRGGAPGPGHQPADRRRLVRGRGRGARAGDRELPGVLEAGEPPSSASTTRSRGPRVRARGAAGRALDAGDAATRRRRSSSQVRGCSSPRTSCAASSPTCARRSPTSRPARAGRSRS